MTQREERGGGCLVAISVLLGLALLVAGAGALWLVLSSQPGSSAQEQGAVSEPRAFADYSWDELSEISGEIAAAPSPEEAASVAASHGIHVGDTRTVTLEDGTEALLRVIGLAHDERADGSGKAGITLLTSPIALRQMSGDAANEGGWEASDLRSWFASDGLALLPDELAAKVVAVSKDASSRPVRYGSADLSGAVTQTEDALWVPSLSEVCGDVTLMTDEYGTEPSANTEYVDFVPYDELLSSEGEQYEFFREQGVSGASDAAPALQMSLGGSPCAWWLRTSYPFTYGGSSERYCYQVMASGLPSGLAAATSEAGVAVGLCL